MNTTEEELRCIKSDLPNFYIFPDSIGIITFRNFCSGNADTVLTRSKEVMEKVISVRHSGVWLENDVWKSILPSWFVNACANEMSKEEVEAWLKNWKKLSSEEKRNQEKKQKWALLDWLHWFSPGPDERQWRWAGSKILDKNCFEVYISVSSWPTAYGTLPWLFSAAGAISVFLED